MDAPLAPLPPLSAIRAFEAAARHGSFTKAAQELAMTQAAVSYQIKQLEDRLGAPLFVRHARKVDLTALGAELAASTSEAFGQLRSAFGRACGAVDNVLVISALPTVAAAWLAPRLGQFQLSHPKLAVRIDTDIEPVDLQLRADVAIRSGSSAWPGLERHFLLPSVYTAVCSPEFRDLHGLRRPQQLAKLPRIGRPSRWARWLAQAEVAVDEAGSGSTGVEFGVEQMEAASAMAGHGVAMVSPLLFRADLQAGRLIQPFAQVTRDPKDYWLVYARNRMTLNKVIAFRQWALDEADKTLRACRDVLHGLDQPAGRPPQA